MKVRYKNGLQVEGYSSSFNTSTLGEVIVMGDWGGDSAYIADLDVFLVSKNEWKDMKLAFLDKDIIPDNYNVWFGEPNTPEDRQRGYFDNDILYSRDDSVSDTSWDWLRSKIK